MKGRLESKTSRFVAISILLLTLIAIPANAATWRTYGTARSNLSGYTGIYTTARSVEDAQLGLYTYGSTKQVDWSTGYTCYSSSFGNIVSNYKSGTATVNANTWKWINIRSSSVRKYGCDVQGDGVRLGEIPGNLKIKIRVR